MKNRILLFPALFIAFMAVSCIKTDSEILGCVEGKTESGARIRLGCMSKVEFDRYLQNPYQKLNGETVNKDLTFTKVEDCLKCQ